MTREILFRGFNEDPNGNETIGTIFDKREV